MFGGARVFVWIICKAARMLQESTCQRHASCPPRVLCFAARCECHVRAHQPHVPTYRARTSARVRSMRPSLPMQRASRLTQTLPRRQSIVDCMLAAIKSPHQHRGTQPSPPSCSEFRLEGLRITPLDPLVVTVRVMLKAHVLCLKPCGWCLMVRIASNDVADSNSRSSVQLLTAVGSGASSWPCSSAWPARGVAISICSS